MVVLLGDVKHNIPSATRQEYRELPGIIATIRDLAPVSVLPGNHDVGIGRFFPDSELLPKNGAVIDGVGYLHGHTIPAPGLFGRLIIAGHHHPMVSLYDEVGCALQAPAYLLAGLDDSRSLTAERDGIWQTTRVLFMPAFNECAGFDILRIVNYPFSPLSRSIQRDSAEVFLCDGTFVGPVSLLEKADAAA
jgi:metallophosphoesterase superfamily enzyme